VRAPEVDRDVTGEELDKDVRRELTTLRAEAAESAAKHLVMTARLLADDPEAAYAHAEAARKHGPRVGVIREALGLAAYHAGKYAEALAELRAARRITGSQDHWPLMADCERALGRPEKALQMAAAPEVSALTRAGKVEMRIVAAGARADLGQLDAAVVTLQSPELNDKGASEWLPRLRFAYAAALEAVGRADEARTWFERAAAADPDGLTDAAERLAELDGVVILDTDTDADDEDDTEDAGDEPRDPAAEAARREALHAAVARAAARTPRAEPDEAEAAAVGGPLAAAGGSERESEVAGAGGTGDVAGRFAAVDGSEPEEPGVAGPFAAGGSEPEVQGAGGERTAGPFLAPGGGSEPAVRGAVPVAGIANLFVAPALQSPDEDQPGGSAEHLDDPDEPTDDADEPTDDAEDGAEPGVGAGAPVARRAELEGVLFLDPGDLG
jgi:tetratricopeptide (TPR) repeat protein